MTTAKRVPLFLYHPSSSLCFVIVGKVTKHNQDYNPIHDFVMQVCYAANPNLHTLPSTLMQSIQIMQEER